MPSYLSPHRHVRTGRSGCVPGLRIIPDVSINTSPHVCRKNSKSWQRPRARLSHSWLALHWPPLLLLHQHQHNHILNHHARALPCQFPVVSNANLTIALSHSPTRRVLAPPQLMAAVAAA